MEAAQCAPPLCGGKPNDLVADTASHRLNFLAACLNGTETPPKRPAIRRMSDQTHAGQRRGQWPDSPEIRAAMFEHYNKKRSP